MNIHNCVHVIGIIAEYIGRLSESKVELMKLRDLLYDEETDTAQSLKKLAEDITKSKKSRETVHLIMKAVNEERFFKGLIQSLSKR